MRRSVVVKTAAITMKLKNWGLGLSLVAALCIFPLTSAGQQSVGAEAASTYTASAVPQLVNHAGVLADIDGKPLTRVTGVTFLLYRDQQSGSPLWMETQNVQPDKSGHYSVVLGSTTSQGLPQDVFAKGEARWLGVQPDGQAEQPRVLLLSVPYARKAADAETVGGLPASAFVLANGAQGSRTGTKAAPSTTVPNDAAPPVNPTVTGKGVVNFIPMWDKTSDIIDSLIYVAQKTAASFEVREQGGGTSSIAFDYRIVARRKGYEQIRLADKTKETSAPETGGESTGGFANGAG